MKREPLWWPAFIVLYKRTECRIQIAAARLPIPRSCVYDLLKHPEFKAQLEAARAEVVEEKKQRAERKPLAA